MTKTTHLFCFAVIAALLHCTYAGRTTPDLAHSAVFYTDVNKQGTQFLMSRSGNMKSIWNDKALSFTVPEGYVLTIWENPGQTGTSRGPYTQGSYNVESILSGKVSSITLTEVTNSYYDNCAQFYTDYFSEGNSFYVCGNVDVPLEYTQQASTLIVPTGWSVVIYSGAERQGTSWGPYSPDTYQLTNFNDQTASVALYTFDPACPVFYDGYYGQGNSFQFCHSGPVTSQWDNLIYSFTIQAGYAVSIYADYNQDGNSRGVYAQGTYNVEGSQDPMTGTVSSLSIEKQPDSYFKSNCATFYTGPDGTGDQFYMCGTTNVPLAYNDQAESVSVPAGLQVTAYADFDRGGATQGTYTQGLSSLQVPNSMSSAIVSAANVSRQLRGV